MLCGHLCGENKDRPWMERIGVDLVALGEGRREPDEGCMLLDGQGSAERFLAMCGDLRHWKREPRVHNV